MFYHFIVGLMGVAVSVLLFGVQIYRLIEKLIMLFNDAYNMTEDEFLYTLFIEVFGGLLLISILSAIITKYITSGLSYIPYLYKINNLNIRSILLMSFKKGHAIILFHLTVIILTGIIAFILSFIPLINIVLSFALSYGIGLFMLWLDYHFSRNALHGQKVFSYISFNGQQLFKRTKKEREVFIVPLYYMAASIVGAANLFIRPLFQLRIIKILEDEEQLFTTPPPRNPQVHYPPNTPPVL